MEARRREPFEREPGDRTEPRLVERAAAEVPGRLDLVRWGPTWAGFFVSLAITALLILLGSAVGLSGAATGAPPPAPGTSTGLGLSIWAPISLIIGLMAGGYVMMRLAATGGQFVSLAHGALLWAVTVVLGSLLAGLGMGAVFGSGAIPGFGTPGTPPGAAIPTGTTAAWSTFIGLIIGLGAAMFGAYFGDRARRPERIERVQRQAA